MYSVPEEKIKGNNLCTRVPYPKKPDLLQYSFTKFNPSYRYVHLLWV